MDTTKQDMSTPDASASGATRGSTARREGWQAQKRGDSVYANPYEVQSDPYYAWEEGWFNADSGLPAQAGAR